MKLIDQNIGSIQSLCKQHNVAQLFVFGSVLNEDFSLESDIDFIVDFNDIDLMHYADNYFNLKFSLEELLKREIDLLENKAIKNPYLRNSIDFNKKLVYGQ